MGDVSVHVYGDAAIIEYKLDLTHFAGDTAHLHEIMVWLKSSDGWQLLARHPQNFPWLPLNSKENFSFNNPQSI
jgi:ketosteroid isomerase-like protein